MSEMLRTCLGGEARVGGYRGIPLAVMLAIGAGCSVGICDSPGNAAADRFIRNYQRLVFQKHKLDPVGYRKGELSQCPQQMSELVDTSFATRLEELPTEYEHPCFYSYVKGIMVTISTLGSKILEDMVRAKIGDAPLVATIPTGLGVPEVRPHASSRTNILFVDTPTFMLLQQLARLVAQAVPVTEKGNMSICKIRPRINRDQELVKAFEELVVRYVYKGDLMGITLYRTDGPTHQLANHNLYRPAIVFILAHEYTHAALGHPLDPKAMYPPERRNYDETFYRQENESIADISALAIADGAQYDRSDVIAGAWLYLKAHEIFGRAVALAAEGKEPLTGIAGSIAKEPMYFAPCSAHPLPEVRIVGLESVARGAYGDDMLCKAYTVDWILEYMWGRVRHVIVERYSKGERPSTNHDTRIDCLREAGL